MDKDRLEYAAMMLGWFLVDEKKDYESVRDFCKERGITRGELKAARKELGVKTTKTPTTWLWYVPQEGVADA